MNRKPVDDDIFGFVYLAAMRDATLMKSFTGRKAWMTDCKKFEASTRELKEFVLDVIKGGFSDSYSYDKRFLKVSAKVCEDVNNHPEKEGNRSFTFGNAQKLINIVMKYFYIHAYGNGKEKENFRFCHCPMDSRLLETVWKERSRLNKETGKALGTRDEFLKGWGDMDFSDIDGEKGFPERYIVFQKAVKELSKAKSPLEFDYYEWGKGEH